MGCLLSYVLLMHMVSVEINFPYILCFLLGFIPFFTMPYRKFPLSVEEITLLANHKGGVLAIKDVTIIWCLHLHLKRHLCYIGVLD